LTQFGSYVKQRRKGKSALFWWICGWDPKVLWQPDL